MELLTNVYLEDLAEFCSLSQFIGVFSCNSLPKFPHSRPYSLICNLSKDTNKGTHFIAIYIFPNVIIYYDPYGMECYNKYILQFLLSKKCKIIYNKKCIQHISSVYCGYYCFGFCMFLESSKSLLSYNKLFFKSKLYKNEKIVEQLILKKLRNEI